METIKNYLETMFRGLPQTEKIMKAKSELLQMMEDKYTELIRSGKTENEAVGEVIRNFGNLDDLAEDLGIEDILHKTKSLENYRKKISFEDVIEYIDAKRKSILIRAAGIFLCITCVIFPIIISTLDIKNSFGAILMFIAAGVGIVFITLSNSIMEEWSCIKKQPCSIDAVSIDYLKNKLRDFTPTYSVLSSVGVLLCILCFVPCIFFSQVEEEGMKQIGAALMFVFVGAGVFMMVYAKNMKRAFHKLLNIDQKTDFVEEKLSEGKIQNNTVRIIMSVYWSLITCIYLCISFLTFSWHITWLIWPIAAVVKNIIKAVYAVQDDDKKNN